MIDMFWRSWEIALGWIEQDLVDDKLMLAQVTMIALPVKKLEGYW